MSAMAHEEVKSKGDILAFGCNCEYNPNVLFSCGSNCMCEQNSSVDFNPNVSIYIHSIFNLIYPFFYKGSSSR